MFQTMRPCETSANAPPFVITETPTIIKLAQQCRADAACYQRREPYSQCFCLELFRRAVVEHDNVAWTDLYAGYSSLVRHWLGSAPNEGDEDVSAVFERFWHAVDGPKFAHFASLAAVLAYLKTCARSASLDQARARRARVVESPLDDVSHLLPANFNVEDMVATHVDGNDLWGVAHGVIPDERERLVMRLSYGMGFSPREIQARHHAQFPDVADVYRLKRSVLDRLRRAPEIQAHLRLSPSCRILR